MGHRCAGYLYICKSKLNGICNLKSEITTEPGYWHLQLFALFIIIATGMYQLYMGNVKYFTFDNSDTRVTSLALSFYSGLFAYNGW